MGQRHEDFETAAMLAEKGLRMRPGSAALLNFRAFALGSLGRTQEAEELLKQVPKLAEDNQFLYLTVANAGLCAFREGRFEDGLFLYRQAIDGYRRIGRLDASAHARVYLAQEAKLANHPDAAQFLVEAEKAVAPFKDREGAFVLARLKDELHTAVASKTGEDKAKEQKSGLRSVKFTTAD